MPNFCCASIGALVDVRVITILASWSITTMPTLQAATGPIERKPMPRSPNCGRYFNPILVSGMNSTNAWNATPNVHVPAVKAILSAVQKSSGCSVARPNNAMNVPKPMQLMMFAPAELHAYAVKWSLAARIWPITVYRP